MKRLSVLLLLVAIACGGADPVSLKKLQPIVVLDITGGANQVDTAGKELAPVVAHARDEKTAAPVPGQLVNWIVVSGGGSVFAAATQTDSLGNARQRWTLGWAVGDQVLEARAVDPTTGAPLTFAQVHATALPWFNVTVLVVNQMTWPLVFGWQDGQGVGGIDSVPGLTTRCERFTARPDSAFWRADATDRTGNASASSNWFDPSAKPAWKAVLQSPSSIMMTVESAQC